MDTKKKNLLDNLRLKSKLPNLKKPRKKPLAKQGRNLAHRRSISVPDLTFVPGGAFSSDSASMSTTSDAIYFGISPGLSDTDSIASGSTTDGPIFMDKLNDSFSEITYRVPQLNQPAAALNRFSVPVESLTSYDEANNMTNPAADSKMNNPPEGQYASVDKRGRRNAFIFEPLPAPRSILNTSSISEQVERVDLFGEEPPPERSASSTGLPRLMRANSQGDESNPNTEKRGFLFEQSRPSFEKLTPPAVRAFPDRMSQLDAPLESGDGTSLDSTCGTSSKEQANVFFPTEYERFLQERCNPSLMREFSMEEGLLELPQADESLDEVSFIYLFVFTCLQATSESPRF